MTLLVTLQLTWLKHTHQHPFTDLRLVLSSNCFLGFPFVNYLVALDLHSLHTPL